MRVGDYHESLLHIIACDSLEHHGLFIFGRGKFPISEGVVGGYEKKNLPGTVNKLSNSSYLSVGSLFNRGQAFDNQWS
jgi:hypothetical protein